MTTRYCIHCKWAKKEAGTHTCLRPIAPSPVDGSPRTLKDTCDKQRASPVTENCGPSGRWWVAKDEQVDSQSYRA